MFEEHLSKLTVAQLKEELTNRTLETTGKKAELVSRLNTYLEGKHKKGWNKRYKTKLYC